MTSGLLASGYRPARPRLRATKHHLQVFQAGIGIRNEGFDFCLKRHYRPFPSLHFEFNILGPGFEANCALLYPGEREYLVFYTHFGIIETLVVDD